MNLSRIQSGWIGTTAVLLLTTAGAVAAVSVDVTCGLQNTTSPVTGNDTTRSRYAVTLAGSAADVEHVEWLVSFGGGSLAHARDVATVYDDLGMVQDTYEDHFRIYDVRLGMRLYAVSPAEPRTIHPYVGMGLGYFWVKDDWEDTHLETIDSPYTEYWESTSGHVTEAKGLFPYVSAGMDMPLVDDIGGRVGLVFQAQVDFLKRDNGIDYSGLNLGLGLRFSW